MRKYKVALFIGRFQPFHNGHLYSLNKCLEIADQVMIGVGSSNVVDELNPWDYETREEMVRRVVQAIGDQARISVIVPIPDVHDDQKWGAQIQGLLQKAGYAPSQVVGVGNNEWTNKILKDVGIEVYESGLYKRDELEGIKIRDLIERGDSSWKNRVPEVVVQYLDEHDNAGKN